MSELVNSLNRLNELLYQPQTKAAYTEYKRVQDFFENDSVDKKLSEYITELEMLISAARETLIYSRWSSSRKSERFRHEASARIFRIRVCSEAQDDPPRKISR